jgi:hypothetical protein
MSTRFLGKGCLTSSGAEILFFCIFPGDLSASDLIGADFLPFCISRLIVSVLTDLPCIPPLNSGLVFADGQDLTWVFLGQIAWQWVESLVFRKLPDNHHPNFTCLGCGGQHIFIRNFKSLTLSLRSKLKLLSKC